MKSKTQQVSENDILAALLKVKPTEEMPRPKARKQKTVKDKPKIRKTKPF